MTTPRDRAEVHRSYWMNRLVAVLGAVVLIGGSAALLRLTDSLTLTYLFIAVGVVTFAVAGVLVKRRTQARADAPGQD